MSYLTSPSNASLNLGSKFNPDASIIVLAKSKIVMDELVPTLKMHVYVTGH